jgi:hypothetical protein
MANVTNNGAMILGPAPSILIFFILLTFCFIRFTCFVYFSRGWPDRVTLVKPFTKTYSALAVAGLPFLILLKFLP